MRKMIDGILREMVHDDGRCADGNMYTPLDENGFCPVCKIHPDMQSKALMPVSTNPNFYKDFLKEFDKHQQKMREQERRKTENVDLVVDTHNGCGGEIHYHSTFVLACSPDETRYGGPNPQKEDTRCSCNKCGVLFDTSFKRYRDQIEKHRHGPHDEDVPKPNS